MGLRENSYAKIKTIEYKDSYAKGQITISEKVKNSNPVKFYCSWTGYVSFVGDAFLCKPQAGQKIKIISYDNKNGYLDKDGNQQFSKTPNVAIFKYELQADSHSNSTTSPAFELVNDETLPF